MTVSFLCRWRPYDKAGKHSLHALRQGRPSCLFSFDFSVAGGFGVKDERRPAGHLPPGATGLPPLAHAVHRSALFSAFAFSKATACRTRYFSCTAGVVGKSVLIGEDLLTVNPIAVNQPGVDVFSENKRRVLFVLLKLTTQLL